jgi:hypothetical protein
MYEREMDFFKKNQTELVSKYKGQVLVIVGEEVKGSFPSALKAYLFAKKSFPLGSFMIQSCIPGPEAYTVTVSSSLHNAKA